MSSSPPALYSQCAATPALGDAMHVVRADLRLQRRAERPEQRGVQRLVAVRLGNRDVVLELAGDRLVQAVQHAERRVARRRVLDQHAHAVDVEDLREAVVLLAHLLVHAVDGLLAAGHRRRDAGVLQAVADRLQDAVHHLAPVAARGLDRLGEHAVAHRIEMLERRAPAAPGRARSGRAGWRSARRCRASRARCARDASVAIASSVRMLCSRSASLIRMTRTSCAIASSILRKLSACGSSRDWNSIWSSLDTPSTMSATGLPNELSISALVTLGVLHHVVEERGGEPLRVEPPLRQDAGYRERVRDVGLAGLAELSLVRVLGEREGALDERDVRGRQVVTKVSGELRDFRHARSPLGFR